MFVRDIHQVIEGYAPPALAPPVAPGEPVDVHDALRPIDRDR